MVSSDTEKRFYGDQKFEKKSFKKYCLAFIVGIYGLQIIKSRDKTMKS